MAPEGDKKGSNTKAAITEIFLLLLMQLIYTGKIPRCRPKGVEFPNSFDLNFNESHWVNENTSHNLIENIIIPFVILFRFYLALKPS